jgi:hypothetical protein
MNVCRALLEDGHWREVGLRGGADFRKAGTMAAAVRDAIGQL